MQDMQTMEECNLKEDGMCIHLFERKFRDESPRADSSGQFQPVSSSTTSTEIRVAQIRVETVDVGSLDDHIQIQRRTVRLMSAFIVSGPYQYNKIEKQVFERIPPFTKKLTSFLPMALFLSNVASVAFDATHGFTLELV